MNSMNIEDMLKSTNIEDMDASTIKLLQDLGRPGGELYQLGYEYIKPLGQGGSGSVGLYRVFRLSPQSNSKKAIIGDELAIKVIDIYERTTKLATKTGKTPQEVRETVLKYLLKEARLTGIINREIKTCGADADYILNYQTLLTVIAPDSRFFYLVSEPMAGDLSELNSEDLDDKTVMGIICQLIYALACLHSIGVIHGDLKPSNIFITKNGSLKLGDFGESAYINIRQSMPAELSLITGTTPSYSAPENLIGHRSPATKYDLWSLGLVILNLMDYRPSLDMKSKFKLGDLKTLKQSEITQIIDHLYLHSDMTSSASASALGASDSGSSSTNRTNISESTMMLRKLLKKLLRIKPIQRIELNKLSETFETARENVTGNSGVNSKNVGCPRLSKSLQTKGLNSRTQGLSSRIQRVPAQTEKVPTQTQRVSTQSYLTPKTMMNGQSPIITSDDTNQTQKPFWNWLMDSLEMVAELPPKGVQWLKHKLAKN